MAKGSDLDRVTAIVLREMRGPIFMLLAVYTVGITGIVLIPGQDAAGNPVHMGLFHAFYFMTYTATTTGFGELPHQFTEPQRMWAIACLYMSVVTWIYAIGAIAKLIQNPFFAQAVAQRRFAVAVRRIDEPFVIVCGFGDTGSLLARGLSDHGITGVVIDEDQERIKALALRDYKVQMPGLCADASVPKNLIDAGLPKANCRAVVLLTDEALSLKIAVMTRLLNPQATVICRTRTRAHAEELRSLGSVIIADPFEAFARELSLALDSPPLHTLDEWLVGAHGASLRRPLECPMGTWVLCGYGRMGQWLHRTMTGRGVHIVVVAANIENEVDITHKVIGPPTRANLKAAGIADAVGVLACTSRDTENLSVLLNARALNPEIFLVVRQNSHENELAFNAANANLIMQPSLVSARRILLMLISPLIQQFLDNLEARPELLEKRVYPRLLEVFDTDAPMLWVLHVQADEAPALMNFMVERDAALGELLKDPRKPQSALACVPLLLDRQGRHDTMPAAGTLLEAGDRLLLCGTPAARHMLNATLNNPYLLLFVLTGEELPRGILGYLGNRRKASVRTS